MATIDLSTYVTNNSKFKSKTIKVNKLSETQNFNFGDDVLSGQVEVKKVGGKLVVNVYAQKGVKNYTFRTVYVSYGHKGKSGYPKWTDIMYYDKNGDFVEQKSSHTHVSKPGKSSTKHQVLLNGKVYKTVKSSKDFADYTSSGTPSVSTSKLGTYTIVNAQDVQEGVEINIPCSFKVGDTTMSNKNILELPWEIKGSTSNYFAGSDLNEYANSTAKSETFAMGAGTDTIYFSGLSNYGKDTIKLSNKSSLTLQIDKSYDVEVQRDKNGRLKSSDVILHLGGEGDPNGKITIKNFLKMSSAQVKIGSTNLNELIGVQELGSSAATTKQTLVGSGLDEIFHCGTKNDVVLTGGGHDTVNTGTGNETIKITGGGQKDINISGSGTTTITRVLPNGTGTAYLNFNTDNLSYIKGKGNNTTCLIISDGTNNLAVVNGFFGGSSFNKTFASDDTANIGARITDGSIKLLADYRDKSTVTIRGSKYSDKIYGGKRTNYIYAEGGSNDIYVHEERTGKTKIKAGDGNDTYNIANDMSKAKNTYIIHDNGGTQDKLIFSLPVDTFSYFNISVDKEGNVSNETTLHLLETSKVMGAASRKALKSAISSSEKVTIENALESDGDTGKGWIEQITNSSISESSVNTIRSQVAGWLDDKGYTSVTQALNKETDVSALLTLMSIYNYNS